MRLLEAGFPRIVLVDSLAALAQGKALDLEDAGSVSKYGYRIQGTQDIQDTANSDIIIITAGLTRKAGMSREDLLMKNAGILKEISLNIKKLSPGSIVIVVTNPLDLMTYLTLKITGFTPNRVFGMGPNLDAARFANLISRELNVSPSEIDAPVIGSHGEGMLPLPRFTTIKGASLHNFLKNEKIEFLVKRTRERGQEIVSLLGNGSAYFAPSAAIAVIVKAIAKDEKRPVAVSCFLNGEYGIKDICLGTPCRLGKNGIEQIIEVDLNNEEKAILLQSAESIRKNLELLKPFYYNL